MATISATPSLQAFSQLARLRQNDDQEVILGSASSREPLKTRGNFASRMVEIFRPQRAENQHRAVAEAFINAISTELGKVHDTNSAFHNSQELPTPKREQMLTNLRGQLADQLEGQARLTGGDIRSVLEWLKTEVQYQVYAETMEVNEAVMGELELASEDNDRDFNVRRVIDKFDKAVPLTKQDMKNLQNFDTAYKPTAASIDHYLDEDTGIFPKLEALIDSKRNAANDAGRLDEAQAWDGILQWSNSQNREVLQRIKDLSGVDSKVNAILSHLQESTGAPQQTFARLAQPAVTGSMGEKSILRNKNERSPFDPNAVLVDDGRNDEVPEDAFNHSVVDETLPRADVRMHRSMADLNEVDPSAKEFSVRFSAGRAVKSFNENQAPNPNLEAQPDPAEPAATETLKP